MPNEVLEMCKMLAEGYKHGKCAVQRVHLCCPPLTAAEHERVARLVDLWADEFKCDFTIKHDFTIKLDDALNNCRVV